VSLRQGREVSVLIAERLPATLELALVAALIATLVGIPLGVCAALRRRHWDAKLTMAASLPGVSPPTFLIGIVLIEIFSVVLGWFPSFGRGATVQIGGWSTGLLTLDGWRHLALPAVTLAVYQLMLVMRLVRAEMLEALRSDYVKSARACGLPDRFVNFGHALRNTLVPVLTISGLQLGGLIAFSVITETVFAWPGMGGLFIQAVQFPDVPVMAAHLCLIALMFVVINLVVDLLYVAVDPRRGARRTTYPLGTGDQGRDILSAAPARQANRRDLPGSAGLAQAAPHRGPATRRDLARAPAAGCIAVARADDRPVAPDRHPGAGDPAAQYPHELSGGMTQARGAPVMLITHDMGVIAETCDRVAVMYAGRIVEIGPVDEVIHHPAHPYTVGLMASGPSLRDGGLRLAQIQGSLPRLDAIPSVCAVHPRCRKASSRCSDERPELALVQRTRAACWWSIVGSAGA
jgi:peptide/nickel transport system permease protein